MEYFVLYDLEDNIVCYFDNIYEVKRYLPNYRLRDIKRRFFNSDFIKIIIFGRTYKLYHFN